ncbi:protein SPT2 homolog [Syngnathoides biaculeatus]|uniref:protein SPT2 homolog n=1 Tax=Syngnathoides biaculeatus TaxID=300417 RepID=UPI002ADD69E0|nr:protein SPT2 homolog [Syngnathoides biaculeatus]
MMDFDNVLSIATQNQGGNSVQKRYSLQAGPPKKDPKSKGVNPAAIQALLKKRQNEARLRESELKKQKEDLLAKRVELKSDRKARAMASRTKDNFKGYNGIPVVDVPKKRRTKQEIEMEKRGNDETFRNYSVDPEDDEDNYEYEQTDSEPDTDPEPVRHGKNSNFSGNSSSARASPKKPSGPPKSAPLPLNFADLLKLAEKKQFEPVELKAKTVKDERLRTAEELKELEMERKAKNRNKDLKTEREHRPQSSSGFVRKNTSQKEPKNCKPQKGLPERPLQSNGVMSKSVATPHKTNTGERERERPKISVPSKNTSPAFVKQGVPKPSSKHTFNDSSDLRLKKESSSSVQGKPSGMPQSKPHGTSVRDLKSPNSNPQKKRPTQVSSAKQERPVVNHKSGMGESPRFGSNPGVKSSANSLVRPSSSGNSKEVNQRQSRPGVVTPQPKASGSDFKGYPAGRGGRPPGFGQGRALSGGSGIGPGRGPGGGPPSNRQPSSNFGSGPGRPKCTVVSETISSKNVSGARPGVPPRPGIPQRPGFAPRPGGAPRPLNRPPGATLPPITIAYKRKYEEEEEYDSEMDDFIDDGEDEQAEVSKHIKEIFGYDKSKYKDESDYALKFMESSWRDMQKEEARSLKLAVQEDLEEERKEQEEMKRINAKRKK